MSQLASRKQPQLLSPFWPLDDQHGAGRVELDAKPPSNPEEVMPLLLELAAQSDAMHSLRTSTGDPVSDRGATALRAETAERLVALAELVDPESAALIRMRARALAGGAGHREIALEIAGRGASPALEIICGPLCAWRSKTDEPLHSFLAAARNERLRAQLESLDTGLEEALDELRAALDTPAMAIAFTLPMNVADLIVAAGEAADHPGHFTYFLPEDEGVDDLPLEQQRTLYLRNVHRCRYSAITVPLTEALLDGPRTPAEVDVGATLPPWVRAHDHGHNLIAPETDYRWMDELGVEPFMLLQEAIANVYGFLLTISESWLRIAGVDRLEMCATRMAELLSYMRRGPWHHGNPGAAFLELGFLAENGFVEIDGEGRIAWDEEGLCRGVTALARALTQATVTAPDGRGSAALIARYGWPAETPATTTLAKLRDELPSLPTSLAMHRGETADPAEVAA